ncbi:MAG: lamin tail domain-containing protein [Gammaproteobacteria bacterium]
MSPTWATSDVVVSQVYGGGGGSGVLFKQDFVELFNRGRTAISLSGWTVQYAFRQGKHVADDSTFRHPAARGAPAHRARQGKHGKRRSAHTGRHGSPVFGLPERQSSPSEHHDRAYLRYPVPA